MNDGKNEFKVVPKGPWVPCVHCGLSTPFPCRQLQFYFLLHGAIVRHIVWYGHPVHVCLLVTSCSMLKWLILSLNYFSL